MFKQIYYSMDFAEIIGGIVILVSLYYIGVIISRCTLLSARMMELEMQEKEVKIKHEQLKLLEGSRNESVSDVFLLHSDIASSKKAGIKTDTLRVVVGEKVQPKNRW